MTIYSMKNTTNTKYGSFKFEKLNSHYQDNFYSF